MDTKRCIKCDVDKDLDCFQLRNDTKKLRNECKECRAKQHIGYKVQKPKAQRLAENTAPEKICTKCKLRKPLDQYQKRTDGKSERYRNDCIECRNKYVAEFKRTSEKTKVRQNQRARERRQTDPCYLINGRIRARLRKALNEQETKKSSKLLDILGCTIAQFKQHMENQFKPGMSWEERNFVLDHIIPCSYFDLTDIEHQKACFHYTNMQPLTFIDNARKSDQILPEYQEHLLKIETKLSRKLDDGRKKLRVRLKSTDNTMDNSQPSS